MMRIVCWIIGHRFGNEVTIELAQRHAERTGEADTVRITCQRCGRDFTYREYVFVTKGVTLVRAGESGT